MDESEPSVVVTVASADPSPRAGLFADILEKTKETVRSGILHRIPRRASIVLGQDGSGDAPAITQDEWEHALDELSAGVTTAQGQPATHDLRDRAKAHRESGQVPIYVAGFDYETLRDRVWAAIDRMARPEGADGARIAGAPLSDLVESRRAFLASAMLPDRFAAFVALPHIHYGAGVTFIVPIDALLGTAAGASELTIDFGDDAGPRTVRAGEAVDVRYASFGAKIVTVRLEGDAPRTARFQFVIADDPFERPPCPNQPPAYLSVYGPIAAPVKRPGIEEVTAELGVVRRTLGRTTVIKPLLLVEGFPGNYAWGDMWRYANRSNFACDMLARGHDLVFVRFPKGPARIQANAYALIGAIQWALANRENPDDQLIVGGFSMGGLVARYALAFMEHERKSDPAMPDHETARFFTIDSPHEGANVPVSVQALAQAMDAHGKHATQLRSNAAQQMLFIWVPPAATWFPRRTFGPSDLRDELLRELERVGQMPRKPRTIAVSNGAVNGKVSQASPGVVAMHYECFFPEWADLYMYPAAPNKVVFDWRDDQRVATLYSGQQTGLGYDSAPGGLPEDPVFAVAFARVPRFLYSRENPVKNACFIPTVSALAIPNQTNYFQPVDPEGSRFDKKIHCQDENREHVEITPQIASLLIQYLTTE